MAPWYTASTLGGSAELAGWGAWSIIGELDASLRPLPLAVFVYVPVIFMSYGAWTRRFGLALVGALATAFGGLLPFMLKAAVDRRLPGGDAVAVAIAAAPLLVLAVGLVASTVCWVGYARWVLRAAPKAET